MKVELVRYSEDYRQVWEKLVASSINGTFLHSRAFFDHNPLNSDGDSSFLFFKNGSPVGLFPACLYKKDDQLILHSHLRATYGGFVVNEDVRVEEAVEMVQLLISYATVAGVSEVIIRNPFRILNKSFCDETDYAMWYHGFAIKNRELEIAIDLKEGVNIESRYDDSTKRSIRKGKKAVKVTDSIDFEGYWKILETNLEAKHAAKPTHNYKQFCSLLQHVGKEKIKLFAADLDGKMIGGIIVFLVNETSLHGQYIASDAQYQDLRPLNVVIDYINAWGSERKYKYFNLGTANENGGRGINYGLFRFKEGFGGRGVLRETMHFTIK